MASSSNDAAFREAVRSRLAAGTTAEQSRRQRKRLMRNVLLGCMPMAMAAFAGQYADLSLAKKFLIAAVAAAPPIAFLVAYRPVGITSPQSVSDAQVDAIAAKSTRCTGCGAVVLSTDRDECLTCGRLTRPIQTAIIVVAALAVIVVSALWRARILAWW